MVGDAVEEARAKRAKLDSLVNYANGIGSLSIALGHDASKFDPDGPLPEFRRATPARAAGSGRSTWRSGKTDRAAARPAARRASGLAIVGTPETIADEMEEWLVTKVRRLPVQFPYLPGGLDDFVDRVVPELQRRGIFRREYEGTTLRENLGLPRPKNRFFLLMERKAKRALAVVISTKQ